MRKKVTISLILIICLVFIGLGLSNHLTVTTYDYTSSKVPESFDGYKILQISDLHCERFGTNQSELLSRIQECNPDIILLTGDIVDSKHANIRPVIELLMGLNNAYPMYYVTGNHELYAEAASNFGDLLDLFQSYDVTLLDDTNCEISIGDDTIRLYGQKFRSKYVDSYIDKDIDTNYFNVLLYHGCDYFDMIAQYDYDLLFAGHLHGGVIRLPFVGGVLAANSTLFPKYDKGMYEKNGTTMIASAGLGDARIPRFYNDSELVLVTLHHE